MLLSFVCLNAFAARNYGDTYKMTLKKNQKIEKKNLDLIGGTVINRHDKSTLMGDCTKCLSTGGCEDMNFVLEVKGVHYKVYDSSGHEISISMRMLKDRLNLSYWNSLRSFADYDSKYQRAAGDFTGELGMMCAYESSACALLLLLPVSIAADLVMLPIDLGVPFTQNNIKRNRAKRINKIFDEKNDDVKKMGHRKFQRLLDNSLSI
jgi:hypothetical protein